MAPHPEDGAAGIMSLLSDISAGIGRLVQGEFRLARAEATEGLKAAGSGLAKIAVAAVVGLVGLNVLAGAAVAALAVAGLGPVWAALVVGLVLCLVALGLAMAGRAALRLRGIWPDRALRGLRRDAEAVQQGLTETGVRHG
ncbi:phage holin family protein [Tabrizicola sp.]|uniref:phage holin family protein n=1 Tax=Tabrizicola sp. TaxID=2005166 RepID=UPI002FDDFAE0